MKFCEHLKNIRVASGYTQQNVADLLGIDRSTYAYYELGKTEPSIRNLKRLSALYKIPMDKFLQCAEPREKGYTFASADVSATDNMMSFRSLDKTEQQLVMLCRCVRDKEALLQYIRSYEEPEETETE